MRGSLKRTSAGGLGGDRFRQTLVKWAFRGARPRWRCCFYAAVRWLGHTPYHSPRLAFVIAAVELGLAFRLLMPLGRIGRGGCRRVGAWLKSGCVVGGLVEVADGCRRVGAGLDGGCARRGQRSCPKPNAADFAQARLATICTPARASLRDSLSLGGYALGFPPPAGVSPPLRFCPCGRAWRSYKNY